MTKQKNILYFNEINKEDIALVGGKGANLGEMYHQGFPVPNGFCITTLCYEQLIEGMRYDPIWTKLGEEDGNNLNAIQKIATEIRERIIKIDFLEAVKNEIKCALENIGEEKFYAVRSSATAEDLPTMSFAGQQDTYLNIKGVEGILKAVKACMASLFTDRAIMYRLQNNIEHDSVLISVVVQEMAVAKKSGIVFTANPSNNNFDECVIDASYGLGEALVSGLVNPDMYIVDKTSYKIKSTEIGTKDIQILPQNHGGVKTVNLDDEEKKQQVLENDTIIELAKLANKIEAYYGIPQDIEWCIDENSAIKITQARPITSLYPKPKSNFLGNRVFMSFNHMQMMLDPISPLGIDTLSYLVPLKSMKHIEKSKYISACGGRIYFDVTPVLLSKIINFKFAENVRNVDEEVSIIIKDLILNGSFKPSFNHKLYLSVMGFARPIISQTIKYYKSPPMDGIAFVTENMEKKMISIEKKLNNVADREELVEVIVKMLNGQLLDIFKTIIPIFISGGLAYNKVKKVALKKHLDIEKVENLLVGLEGNITTEMGLKTYDLGDILIGDKELIEILEQQPNIEGIKKICDLNEGFKKEYDEFMSKYGMRTTGEIDIARTRYKDDPSIIISNILNHSKNGKVGEHRAKFEKYITQGNDSVTYLEKHLGNKYKDDLKRIRNYLPLREHGKYYMVRTLELVRNKLMTLAKYLEENNIIRHSTDIYFLTYEEIKEGLNGKSYIKTIEKRQEYFSHYKALTPPKIILQNGEVISGVLHKENTPKGAFVGKGVSRGIVEGTAKVIMSPNDDVVKKDEILIAPFTDPGWTPLFANAAGLIVEIGGMMTHGAVVAREYGIPALVGVQDATKLIKTGDYIRINANEDYVEIIKKSEV